MVKAGLSEVIGSWKIIEILLPRSSRSCAAGRPRRSVPSNRTAPPAMRPGGWGTRPMMLWAVTLLPQPLSPTTPRVRPAKSVKLTPSTARNSPSSVAKCVLSSLTSRSGVAPSRLGESACPVGRWLQLMVSVIAGFVSLCRYFGEHCDPPVSRKSDAYDTSPDGLRLLPVGVTTAPAAGTEATLNSQDPG